MGCHEVMDRLGVGLSKEGGLCYIFYIYQKIFFQEFKEC